MIARKLLVAGAAIAALTVAACQRPAEKSVDSTGAAAATATATDNAKADAAIATAAADAANA
ncbi:MAG TPA: hypothetical protein VF459_10705, partial [Caulobacteraceae bacterium]